MCHFIRVYTVCQSKKDLQTKKYNIFFLNRNLTPLDLYNGLSQIYLHQTKSKNPLVYAVGRVAQSVTCLSIEACLTADPGVASLISAWSHTFVEINHEIISTVILLHSAESFKKGCCQLHEKVCPEITGYRMFRLAKEKVWLGELINPP